MKKYLLFCILLILWSNLVVAQSYRYTIYNTETSNLPQNQIMSLFQDSKGNIWAGTKFGAAKYDGENFKIFGQEEGILPGDIHQIFETGDGEILLCIASAGLTGIKGNKVNNYPKPQQFNDLDFTNAKDSILIKASIKDKPKESALLSFKNGNYRILKKYESINTRYCYANDTIWTIQIDSINFGKINSLDKKLNLKEVKFNIKFLQYYSIADTLYLLQTDAIYKYFHGNLTKIVKEIQLAITIFNRSGIYLIDQKNRDIIKQYNFSGKLLDTFKLPFVSAVLQDKENNTWFGTENGLYKLSDKAFRHFIFEDYGIAPDNPGIVFDGKDLWLSSYGGEIYKFKNNRFVNFSNYLPKVHLGFLISHIVKTDGTILWGGNTNGAVIQKGSRFAQDYHFFASSTYGLYYDTLTKCTFYGFKGLMIENDKKEIIFDSRNKQELKYIVEIEKDTVNNYFLAHRHGIYKFRDGEFQDFPYNALDIVHDKRHNLWFGGEAGLYFYNNKDFTKIEHPSLKNKAITAMHEVGDSLLLMGTTSGMAAMDLKAFYSKSKTVIKFYNANNGFSGNECAQNGFCEDKNGMVWIPLNDRLIQIDPRHLSFKNVAVEPYISSMSIMDDAFWHSRDTSTHELSHRENKIRFQFSGAYFSNPVTYSYYLEGYDNTWSEYGNAKEAVYANLPPGKYTFYVKAANGEESENILKASYSFVIKPAFWQTAWFLIVSISILVLCLLWIIRLIVKSRTEKQQKQYQQHKLMMQAQLSQLDPHFIFNTLTTTGTFALRLKQVGIYDIIVRFSQLLRVHWNNNDLTRTLSEELEFVKEYCELNRINHSDRFDYSIEIEPAVDTSIILLKLSLQNFVENSIKHGIESITGQGEIKIKVAQDSIYTRIVIEDNGIGYSKSLLKKNGQKGIGMKTITETFNLYNSWNKYKLGFEIKDKSEIDSTSTGTIVEICIPNEFRYSY